MWNIVLNTHNTLEQDFSALGLLTALGLIVFSCCGALLCSLGSLAASPRFQKDPLTLTPAVITKIVFVISHVAQQVKSALQWLRSLLWHGFDPWPVTSICHRCYKVWALNHCCMCDKVIISFNICSPTQFPKILLAVSHSFAAYGWVDFACPGPRSLEELTWVHALLYLLQRD